MSESSTSREDQLAETFVTLADTLVSGFDIVGLFHDLAGACVELLAITDAGLMLVDVSGRLRIVASSSERSRLLELMEIQNEEGPCLECHRSGTAVLGADLATERDRWPNFTAEALRVGFRSVYAVPMRLRSDTIGALNLFHTEPNQVSESSLRLAQALADVATIAILQQRAAHSSEQVSNQLQAALTSRIVIEQAKGLLAGRLGVDMPGAFALLRDHARRTQRRLSDVAQAVVTGTLAADQLQKPDSRRDPKSR